MASEVKTPGMKQLKVDNWATFFMQRLQLLFAKGDSCDITLKFFTGQELKVHSLVLRTCTSHFDTLPKQDDVISLPEILSYSAVFPIINFMYSGKLEFKPELHSKLLGIAKILNITILLKLLLAQRDGPSGSNVKAKAITATPEKPSPQQIIVQQTTPSSSYSLFSGKKLPFWRKRTLPIVKYGDRKPVEDEPGPTRFNWPENEPTDWLLISSPSFCGLSYETDAILKAPIKIEPDRTLLPPRRIIESRLLTTHDSDDDDDDRFETNYSSDEEVPTPPPPPPPPLPPAPPVLKPCLKTPSTESQTPPATKRVRFSLGAEGKENSVNSAQTSASNHAKIIAEVLKKYPDLVKNKNIKLKISSPKPKVENGVTNEEKASYVVLRPTVRAGTTAVTPSIPKNEPSSGPWSCDHCPEIKFEHYQDFRKHIQEAHGEKLDARICEYCGYKASKRNLHLYHLFTKHNVPPPKNISFPKCSECSYIALSESLLAKHMNNHMQAREMTKEIPKENQCDICKVVLRNQASLCAHKVTCKPGNEPRNIICDLCKTAFRTNVSLNAHLKECQGKPEPTAIFSEDGDQPVEMIEVPIIEAVNMEKGDHTLVQLPSGIILAGNQNMALLPASTDADGLNGVTTSIATSLALALPQDQQAVILLHGNGQEYIVPEFLEGNFTTGNIAYTTGQNQVIYLGSSSGNGTNQDVIHLEEIKISPTSPSTSAIQEKSDNKEVVQQTLSVVQTSGQDSKSQIGQNVIINVQGDLAQTANDQLDQSGLILVNTNKEIGRNLQQAIVGGSGKSSNSGQKLILQLPEENDNEVGGKIEALQTAQVLQEDGTLIQYKPSEEREVVNEEVTMNKVQFKENEALSTIDLTSEQIVENESLEQDSLITGNTLQEKRQLQENIVSKDSALLKENDVSSNKGTETPCNSNEILSKNQMENVQEVSFDSSKPCEVINISNVPTQDLKLNESITITVRESNIQQVQEHIESEQMQVDEGREDMIVDENKDDEEMDVEDTMEQRESKDAMDVEESDKTGDERVDSLVKDWGFDDEDTEEVIDDPDRKPLRPDIDIQL